MKKVLYLLAWLSATTIFAQQQTATFSTNPPFFAENEQITVTVSGLNPTLWNAGQPDNIYLWAWSYDLNDTNLMDSPTNGTWTNSDESQQLTNNGNGTYSITFTPTTLFQRTGIGRMGMLVKADNGTGDKKSQDHLVEIGGYQLLLNTPSQTLTIVTSGDLFPISAQTSLPSDFVLRANGVPIDTILNNTHYTYDYVLTTNTFFELQATNAGETLTETFQAVITPTVTEEALPPGLQDGINLNPADATRATLVLYAPGKDFVHLIGDFNNWRIDDAYLMRRDPATNRFWLELTGLTPQYNHRYQYLVEFTINVADPYSTTILDEFNDPYIDALTYPNLPAYPSGGTTEPVTVLRTGDPDYVWQTPVFQAPARTDLVIYELLLRDFDALHSFDALRNRLDYLQTLGVNAIELMPVSEFDGNESWGYNPSFHMALDKYYGTRDAFKQLIDECHTRGMAVIIDVVYNHASGQNPYYRLWNTVNGGTGGQATAENPFFNATATHSYSVFNDFNHQSAATQHYVNRTLTYWIEEFHIDGFRWDLTKGFTQNCAGSESCTNNYQADRVAVLEQYADTQWAANPNFYVIFEHLGVGGSANEETDWINYRLGEGKGIMVWNKLTDPYNQATMGFHSGGISNFSGVSYKTRGWTSPSSIAYMESHDEERLMYRNLQSGNVSGAYNVKNLNTALDRMKTSGAFFFTVPGPKMIWQFGELGYDYSIELNGRTGNKPIRWDYYDEPNRKALYDLWAILIDLKKNEPIFKTDNFTLDVGNTNGLKKIQLTLNSAAPGELRYVTIIGNFGVTAQNINPTFQQTGVWYNFLNGNLKQIVTNITATISLQPGEFRIYGDQPTALLPNNNPPDADSDGVLDAYDICLNTTLGALVDVNGCEVFTLPVTNFTLKTAAETCISSNNGSIQLTAVQSLSYTAALTGNGVNQIQNFSTMVQFSNLSAGVYSVCITVAGQPGYQRCFEAVVGEPQPLAALSKVNTAAKQVTLSLSGGELYYVELNGALVITSESSLTLDLPKNRNQLTISTDKSCQGTYSETILLAGETLVYPNPFTDFITVQLGTDTGVDELVTLSVYTYTGQRIISEERYPENNRLSLPVHTLPQGNYLLEVKTRDFVQTHKIIKQ